MEDLRGRRLKLIAWRFDAVESVGFGVTVDAVESVTVDADARVPLCVEVALAADADHGHVEDFGLELARLRVLGDKKC